jgi:hypothetical protein
MMNKIYNWQDGQNRLDHYNAWLMDNTREFGKPYPGYPGDKNGSYSHKTIQKAPVLSVTVAEKPKKSYNRHINTNTQGNIMTKVTNLSRATEIVKASATKAEALDKIVAELSVTRSNAFVYFTKATKLLGSAPVAGDKAPKVAKASAKATAKANPVTGLTADKKAKKVAEIDATIAKLKAKTSGATSPFGQAVALSGLV